MLGGSGDLPASTPVAGRAAQLRMKAWSASASAGDGAINKERAAVIEREIRLPLRVGETGLQLAQKGREQGHLGGEAGALLEQRGDRRFLRHGSGTFADEVDDAVASSPSPPHPQRSRNYRQCFVVDFTEVMQPPGTMRSRRKRACFSSRLRSSPFLIAFMLTACGRTELLPGTQDSSSIGGLGGTGGSASPTDAASLDTSAPRNECTGELRPYGCPCTNGAECVDGFCATDYAPRSGSSECVEDKVGRCRGFPQRECVCRVTNYGNEGRCYD